VDNAGRAQLRFGDDAYGRRPLGVEGVTARYRVGNGCSGNLGAAALYHVVEPPAADMVDPTDPGAPVAAFPAVTRIWQPLAARDGTDAETIEQVRQLAPRAFHAEQFRAVNAVDYEQAALALPEVAAAKCTFRWTGSWQTVFVALHPRDAAHVVTEAGGRTRLEARFAARARSQLERYRLAGYDLELRTAQYVPLEIAVRICVARGHFRGDVLAAAYAALSNRRNPDGSLGFFHPERFGFGAAVYLSQLYEALIKVPGVDSAAVTAFERYWESANQELETGVIVLAPSEIARLDNDPNFAENGVLEISAVGGL
jgi:predicted phage baseplate assembly protein